MNYWTATRGIRNEYLKAYNRLYISHNYLPTCKHKERYQVGTISYHFNYIYKQSTRFNPMGIPEFRLTHVFAEYLHHPERRR